MILRVRSILFSYLLISIRENYIEMISICSFMDLLGLYDFLISFKKIKELITIEYSNKKKVSTNRNIYFSCNSKRDFFLKTRVGK